MKPSKLFHAIVIAGAALTGCGDDDDRTTDDDAVADAGAAVDAAMEADAGEDDDAFVAIL